eukprot:CAMPEP_0171691712 /NCGR_PEP_ID=MMETSP0991-20121206/5685_1 /TAXON_ID=483369 /ORGANISM="non described non described, Strain CCMP2098" /LENGTH=329 /DNA_ID=CAMNT_0012279959 /DNA_START=102 /DNA_END=1091 /DNA_ORIENTATION=-
MKAAHQDMLTSLKLHVPRVKHAFEGEAAPEPFDITLTHPTQALPPLTFRNSEVVLTPAEKATCWCVPCIPGGEASSLTIYIRHVEDLSKLHLHLKHARTKCELAYSLWSTSRVLSDMLSSKSTSELLTGVKIIEIGAGTALCGMAAAVQGAFVTITDTSDMSIELVSQSAALNGVSSHVDTRILDWHSSASSSIHPEYELLIGSDVLFLRANIKSIVSVVENTVLPGGMAVIICPGRPSSAEFESFVDTRDGLTVESFEAHDLVVSGTSLLKLTRLYFVTVGTHSSPRTIAIKCALREAWEWVSLRPTTGNGVKYEYTGKLGENAQTGK